MHLYCEGKKTNISRGLYYSIILNALYFVAAADITSVNVLGSNLRLAWIMLPLFYIILPKRNEPKVAFYLTVIFFCIHLLSSIISGRFFNGIIYSSWIIFNYIFFFRVAYIIGAELKGHIWDAILWGGRIQVVLAILMVLVGSHERAQFIYFEPSYLAIGLVPYLFVVIYIKEKKLIDALLIFGLVAFNQSANMLVALFLGFVCWVISNKNIYKSIGCAVLLSILILAFYYVALNNPLNPNHGVASWVNENGVDVDLISNILYRGGNRLPRLLAAWDLMRENWFFGFGPGMYSEKTLNVNFDYITGGIDYIDPSGLPVVNVIIEAATNAGIFASIFLVAIFTYVAFISYTYIRSGNERMAVIGAMLTYGVMLQFESSYLRAYIWIAFGLFVSVALRKNNFAMK